MLIDFVHITHTFASFSVLNFISTTMKSFNFLLSHNLTKRRKKKQLVPKWIQWMVAHSYIVHRINRFEQEQQHLYIFNSSFIAKTHKHSSISLYTTIITNSLSAHNKYILFITLSPMPCVVIFENFSNELLLKNDISLLCAHWTYRYIEIHHFNPKKKKKWCFGRYLFFLPYYSAFELCVHKSKSDTHIQWYL